MLLNDIQTFQSQTEGLKFTTCLAEPYTITNTKFNKTQCQDHGSWLQEYEELKKLLLELEESESFSITGKSTFE